MGIFFARMEEKNGYKNLSPVFEVVNGELIEQEFKELFPNTGKITITEDRNYYGEIGPSEFFFCELKIEELYMQKKPTEIQDGKMYNCYRIYDSALNKLSKTVDEYPLYEVFKMPAYTTMDKIKENGLKGVDFIPISKKIFVRDSTEIYGPFSWKNNEKNSLSLAACEDLENKYYIKKINLDELSDVIYKFDAGINRYSENYGLEREVIFCSTFNFQYDSIDFISDKELKEEFLKSISKMGDVEVLSKIKDSIRNIPSLTLSDVRKTKLLSIIDNGEAINGILNEMALSAVNNPNSVDQIVGEILGNSVTKKRIIDEIKDNEAISKDLTDAKNEIRKKTEEKEELEREIQDLESKKSDLLRKPSFEIMSKEIVELNDKKNSLTQSLECIQQKYSLAEKTSEWIEKSKRAQENCDAYNKVTNNLENDLRQKVASAYVDVAFNGAIANEVLNTAATFSKGEEQSKYKNLVASESKVNQCKEKFNDIQDFIDYIYMMFNSKCGRKMTKNDVINVLLCITQGFLTVFAGEPGTGKTSFCTLLSKVLGLNRTDEFNRYIEVSVEKGWTSKRDFIGYYNPLTKIFDKANRQLFDAFNIMNFEKEEGIADFPYIILLDEANLSPMEHYWADFMNVCDLSKKKREINLNEDYILSIPETLRFLATINYDHTTEVLSPRLLDRAWVILLSNPKLDINDISMVDEIEPLPTILFTQFKDYFGTNNSKVMEEDLVEMFNEINKCLRENGVLISPRVMLMIKNYCTIGNDLFDRTSSKYVSLDYALAQKVMPMINGFGDTYKSFLIKLQGICDKNNMPLCNRIINEILSKGEANMQYYQFFAK